MKSNLTRLAAAVSVTLLLGACASTPMPGPSQSQWLQMSEADRLAAAEEAKAYRDSFQSWWVEIGQPLYEARQPVRIGSGENGYTMQWHTLPGQFDAVTFYPGHNPEGMHGNNSEGMYTALADKNGNILYRKDGKTGAVAPNKILANVTTSEDVNRMVVKGAFQVAAGALNGIGAAIVRANDDCGDNCGNTTLINSANPVSLAESAAGAVSNAAVGITSSGCPSGNCVAVPMQ